MIRVNYSDKNLVVEILSNSCGKNKSVNYVVKQDEKRVERIKILMEYSFDICCQFGRIYLSKDKNACALILFPDYKKVNLKSIVLDIKLALKCIGLTRVVKVLDRESKIERNYPKIPVFKLWFIGVHSKYQRKGLGTALLKGVIQESKLMKRPIYLETSTQENLDFYKRLRFEKYQELEFNYKLFLIKKDTTNGF